MIDDAHLNALGSLLDDKGLIVEAADRVSYETGARFDHGKAAFVARPTTTDEVSAVLSYCVRNGIALIPQSGNTGLVSGSIPDGTGEQGVLSLDRLKTLFDLDIDNRTLTVDAGFRLSEINRRLEPHGLFFPIDLGADPCAGGMAATNTGGARFLRYGDVRRNTLGLEVVLADVEGTVLQLGGGLRKDNTGPDWKQCFIGTSGAFGVITACTFNVERLPRQMATALLVPGSDEAVLELLKRFEEYFGADLTAFEGMSGTAMAHALHHQPSLRNPFPQKELPDFVVLVEVSRTSAPRTGDMSLDEHLEQALAELWESESAPLLDAVIGSPTEMWALRHTLSEGVKTAGKLIAFDLSFRRSVAMQFRSQMRTRLAENFAGVTVADFGHIGDGGLHFNLVVDRSIDMNADGVEAVRDYVVTAAVEEFGGSFSAEHGLGRKNQAQYDRYTADRLKAMAMHFKRATSPGQLGSSLL